MPQKLLLIMGKIRTHSQKKKTKPSKNTGSSVNKKETALSKYKITKESQVDSLIDPALYPKENRSRLEDKFLNDYEKYLKLILGTYNHIPYEKFDDFLTSWTFQTFQKNMSIRQKGNRRRKTLNPKDLEKDFELRWNMFLQIFEDMLEDLEVEFRDIATELLRPKMHMFKKMLDLDRKNKGKSKLRDSFLTQSGTEWVNYN